jgi:parallel beta-helix repeat protein
MFHHDPSHTGYSPNAAPSGFDVLWNFTITSLVGINPSSPAVAGGYVYVNSAEGGLYCLDALTGEEIWHDALVNSMMATPAVVDGYLYVGSDNVNFYCFNASTGTKMWNYTIRDDINSPVVVDGYVYVSSEGNVYCFNASTGARIWNYPVDVWSFSSPAVASGYVYIGSGDGNVYALSALTGAKVWNYTTGEGIESSPFVVDGVVYIGSGDTYVYALNAFTGVKIWSFKIGDGVSSSPAVAGGRVYVGSGDRNVYCLDASNGTKVWNYTTSFLSRGRIGYGVVSSPAVAEDYVFVGSADGNFYCLDALTGAKVWNYTTGHQVNTSPAIANGHIYVSSSDGNVYALGYVPEIMPSPSVTPPDGSIVVPDDFSKIQEAVNNAPEGGTVFVRNGFYNERIYIRKSMSLIGEDRENTVIESPQPGPLVCATIEVTADDVTISGFTIKNASIGIWVTDYPAPHPSRCKIIGNNIIDNFRDGIVTEGGENQLISGNTIKGNGEEGIHFRSSNSAISGNNITGNGGGIGINSCGNVTVSNNSISGNGGGVGLAWDGPFYVYGNNITDNQGVGIEFSIGCHNSTAYQNNIARNDIGVNLVNFHVSDSGTIGLGNIVYRNNIVDNSQQAFVEREWEFAEEYQYNNGTDVISWNNGKEGNYWSDYQTQYPNAKEKGSSGIGNTPYMIDENNTDHYPLMSPVTISSTPPPITEPSSDSTLTIVTFVVVVVTIFAVVFFVYRAHRKRAKDSMPSSSVSTNLKHTNPKAKIAQ